MDVVADVCSKLGARLTVERHVAYRAVDEPGRQAIRQPLKGGAIHSLAIVHQRLQCNVSVGTGHYREPRSPQAIMADPAALQGLGRVISSRLSTTGSGPEVLPLGTVGCRLYTGPGDNRRT
jgi:hypothetical protein